MTQTSSHVAQLPTNSQAAANSIEDLFERLGLKNKLNQPRDAIKREKPTQKRRELLPAFKVETRKHEPAIQKRHKPNNIEYKLYDADILFPSKSSEQGSKYTDQEFKPFMQQHKKMYPPSGCSFLYGQPSEEQQLKNYYDLYRLDESVKKRGGIIQVNARQAWDQVWQEIKEDNKTLKQDKLDQIAKKKLYKYQREKYFPVKFDELKVEDIDPNMIKSVPIIDLADPSQQLTHQFFKQELQDLDVFIIRNFPEKMKLDTSIFDMDRIAKDHGNEIINIMNQDPEVITFGLPTQRLRNTTIKRYVDYMKRMKETGVAQLDEKDFIGKVRGDTKWKQEDLGKTTTKTSDKRTHFGVNIDMENFTEQIQQLVDKIPDYLMCDTPLDIQQFFKTHILGMSIPQLYLKVKGVWTGGHQENLSLRAANINYGPGESVWYCVPHDKVKQMNDLLMKKYGCNIYQREGMWFGDEDFCLGNKIPICKFYQQPGDLVVLKPGTLHWVRAMDISVQAAWNFGHWTKQQIEEIIKRYRVNQKYNIRNLVQVKLLFVDLLNEKLHEMEKETAELAATFLIEEFTKEQKLLKKLEGKAKQLEIDEDVGEFYNMTICDNPSCKVDLLQYFYLKENPYQMIPKTYCLSCLLKNTERPDNLEVQARWDREQFQAFIEELKKMLEQIQLVKNGEMAKSMQYEDDEERAYLEQCQGLENWRSGILLPMESIRIESIKKKFFKKEIREKRSRFSEEELENAKFSPNIDPNDPELKEENIEKSESTPI